jgi:hypothetical protein
MTEYKWLEVYKAAVLETDWSKMEERVQAAETALHERKHEFDLDHGGTPEENRAIEHALRGLSVLRRDAASWLERQQLKSQGKLPDRGLKEDSLQGNPSRSTLV